MLRYLVLAAALSSGGAAAWLTVDGGSAPETTAPALQAPIQMTDILVAAGNVEEGGRLSADTLRWQPWPANAVLRTFVTRDVRPDALEEFEGTLVRKALLDGDPISESHMAPANAGFMSALLPAGKRAVAVKVSAESSAGGFVLPNDRVDVVHTTTITLDSGTETTSQVILDNVRVLAVDQSQTGDSEGNQKTVLGQTATLELDIGQVKTITAAQATGSLTLALRSVADIAAVSPAAPPQAAIARPRMPEKLLVTVRRNGKAETVEVKRHTRVSVQKAN
ncbi:Flp pilus assembly protein CpaB [Fulvimarina sp. 2208YS6-2-32]|uniref:Flp pilus assembly protein CpaB n=1 Tax=Fulvimarina uroteuthidis TaxID=3098149 RepID=A0ABU5I5N7_9HYPH|nr:Flp pilus assembly protein CpaB [Fulvimarina sp. 2208YS6-2-32]MDY8110124.1 Flp pilus assembly protein CpaB [Fulvimarina sp. 2208YS6-2-32]